jgi:hypothetical protein
MSRCWPTAGSGVVIFGSRDKPKSGLGRILTSLVNSKNRQKRTAQLEQMSWKDARASGCIKRLLDNDINLIIKFKK